MCTKQSAQVKKECATVEQPWNAKQQTYVNTMEYYVEYFYLYVNRYRPLSGLGIVDTRKLQVAGTFGAK